MASGIFALLDDIAAIAKVAAASLDDAASQSVVVAKKAAGIVIDDTAVTPRYVVGFAAERELPIIGRIAWGSLKNKLLYLLPGALLLSLVAPWAITPLLMLGGLYLCFEGYEKVHDLVVADNTVLAVAPADEGVVAVEAVAGPAPSADVDEDAKVAAAIRTDFILSAEIMAIALASVTAPEFWTKALVLAVVAIMVTVGVYGMVALIVKADDAGYFMARNGRLAVTRALGRGMVSMMPPLLKTLSFIGMLAMLWVGGGILLHGLEQLGVPGPAHAIHALAKAMAGGLGALAPAGIWFIDAAVAGIIGLLLGWLVALVASRFGHGAH